MPKVGTNVVVESTVDDTHSVPLWVPSSTTHHRRVPGEHLEENEQEAEEVADADGEADPPGPRQLADVAPHVLVAEVLSVARAVHGHSDCVEDGYEGKHATSSLAFIIIIHFIYTLKSKIQALFSSVHIVRRKYNIIQIKTFEYVYLKPSKQ